MKRNFKKLLVVASLCLVASAASAQTWAQKKKMLAEKVVAALKDSLNFDTEKATKIQAINEVYQQKFANVAADASLVGDDKKARYGEVYKAKREELKQYMTPQQITKMETLEKQYKKEVGM